MLLDFLKIKKDVPLKDDPEKYYPLSQAFKAKEVDEKMVEFLLKMYPNSLEELSVSIMNCFGEGVDYLNKNIKNFTYPVLILNGKTDFIVDQTDAINYYLDLETEDKSLMVYSGVGHFIWDEEKGDMIPENIFNWIQHRIK